MNERIRELAEQAGTYFGGGTTDYFGDYLPPYVSITDLDLEKFAELIIQKCVAISDDYVKDCACEEHINCKHPRSAIGRKIREHFGVRL